MYVWINIRVSEYIKTKYWSIDNAYETMKSFLTYNLSRNNAYLPKNTLRTVLTYALL